MLLRVVLSLSGLLLMWLVLSSMLGLVLLLFLLFLMTEQLTWLC